MKKSNIVTAVICAVVLSATSFYSGYAASGSSGITYNSQGKIVFNNGTGTTSDDVVFDASDFTTIDNMVSSGKSNIVSELNKYSTTNISVSNPTFNQLATAISNISAGTNATENHILSGKKALVGKSIVTGSIPSKQAATYTPGTSNQTINSGQYLSGNQTIKGDSNLTGANIVSGKSIFGVAGSHICSTLQSQTSDATATDADILSGKTAYVNGTKKTGIMVNNGAVSKALTVGESYTIPQGYHNGSGTISVPDDANLISENIKEGINIFGVPGTLNTSITNDKVSVFFEGKTLTEISAKTQGGTWSIDSEGLYVALGTSYADTNEGNFYVSKESGTGVIVQQIPLKVAWSDKYSYSYYCLINADVGDTYKVRSNMTAAKIKLYKLE